MPQPAYVNSGAYHRLLVSANAVSGLTLAMPASLVAGNLLVAQVGVRVSANLGNDVVSVTGSGVWTLLYEQPVSNARSIAYYKFCTGGEGNLSVLVSAVGAAGNGILNGVVHQFSNVNIGAPFEAQNITGVNDVSGPCVNAGITTTGADRLAVNFAMMQTAVGVSVSPAGETGGDWIVQSYGVTAQTVQLALWTATMSVADTIDGGSIAGPTGTHKYLAVGYALAPCEAPAVVSVPKFHHYLMMANG